MVKGGMWFESKEHYQYYLQHTARVRAAFVKVQKQIFLPLIERIKALQPRHKQKFYKNVKFGEPFSL